MATASVSGQRTALGDWVPWIGLAVLVGLVAGGGSYLVDRSKVTPDEQIGALRSGRITVTVPPPFRFVEVSGVIPETVGPGRAVTVGMAEVVDEPWGSGSPALLTYVVYPSEGDAQKASKEFMVDYRDEAQGIEGMSLSTLPGISYPNLCVRQSVGQSWCHVRVGNVVFEALSRMRMLRVAERDHLSLLTHIGLDHLLSLEEGM